jgi:hypothetical protein
MQDGAVRVAEHLHLNVARSIEVPLEVQSQTSRSNQCNYAGPRNVS